MDHLSVNPHLQISKDTMGPSMMNRDTDCVYGAWGPYSDSIGDILDFIQSHNIVDYKSICDDGKESRWVIAQSTNTTSIAQGPFTFGVDGLITRDNIGITGVVLGQENRTVEMRGLGKSCFDSFGAGQFWVISELHGFNEGESLGAPPTIPSSCDIVAVEASMEPTRDSHFPEVEGHPLEALDEEDFETMIDTLWEGLSNEELVEPKSNHLVDFVGDGTNLGAPCGDEGLAPLVMPIICPEIGHGDPISNVEQGGMHMEESQTLEPLANDVDTNLDDIFEMFGDLTESSQETKLEPSMEVVANATRNDGMASMMQVHGDETWEGNQVPFEQDGIHGHIGAFNYEWEEPHMVEETIVSIPKLGEKDKPSRKRPWTDEPPCFGMAEVNNGMMEATPIFEPIVGDGANGETWTIPKEAQVAKSLSPQSILSLNALPRETNSSSEVDSLETARLGGYGNQDIASSRLGGYMETLEGNGPLDPLLDQETSLFAESQRMSPQENVEDIFEDGSMEGQMVDGMVATTSTSFEGRQPSKKRQRQSKFKQHGVKQRLGGRESFVAYFRPKDLPESDKTFLMIGEFTNEKEAWDAFNLFAFVHEGEESCIDIEDRDSIEMDAAFWGELPRVELLAHLRLRGRGYFQSEVLPSDSFIPRYRNIKFRKNARGVDKGKIRWFCDVVLAQGVTDPYIDNGQKHTCTYEKVDDAAKEADRLSMLNEGYMAWTNFAITDYMTQIEKDQWDPTWIPLQDNPKKHLSTTKYNSFE